LALRAAQILSAAIGTVGGMIAGQVLDLKYEGLQLTQTELERLHRAKTGALIRACIVIGALLAEADESSVQALSRFGEKLGLVFQIVDDILDVEAPSAQLGKTAGKDQSAKKYTFPAALGLEGSRRYAEKLTGESVAELDFLAAAGGNSGRVNIGRLRELCLFLVHRRS
jgi:geranylgeranyl diphosphate synthase type II